MEKELAQIEDEHVIMKERLSQCKRAQMAMAQSVVEVCSVVAAVWRVRVVRHSRWCCFWRARC